VQQGARGGERGGSVEGVGASSRKEKKGGSRAVAGGAPGGTPSPPPAATARARAFLVEKPQMSGPNMIE